MPQHIEEHPAQSRHRRKIYLSGPMTGLPDYNRAAFAHWASRISEGGDIALNPGVLPDGLTDNEYMDICCAMLRSADSIMLLEGWENSPGARAEWALAEKLRKNVMHQPPAK